MSNKTRDIIRNDIYYISMLLHNESAMIKNSLFK